MKSAIYPHQNVSGANSGNQPPPVACRCYCTLLLSRKITEVVRSKAVSNGFPFSPSHYFSFYLFAGSEFIGRLFSITEGAGPSRIREEMDISGLHQHRSVLSECAQKTQSACGQP